MSGQDDDGFDRLLRGESPGPPTERELSAFVDDVREAFPAQPVLAANVHLARITEAAHLLADKGDPVARPVSNAAGRAGHASGLPKRRRATVKVPVWKSLAAKVVAGLVVLMSMFGGVAFAGALPNGLQDAVANVADAVGVNLPGGEDEAEEPAEPVETETEAPDPVETETDAPDPVETESDDQGEDDDSQGEDESATETETDDQGEDGDDQGEDESATETDDQGEDGDDQGEDESSTESETETEADDQGDTQDGTETDDQDQDENE